MEIVHDERKPAVHVCWSIDIIQKEEQDGDETNKDITGMDNPLLE
jgi:hypothetical protein